MKTGLSALNWNGNWHQPTSFKDDQPCGGCGRAAAAASRTESNGVAKGIDNRSALIIRWIGIKKNAYRRRTGQQKQEGSIQSIPCWEPIEFESFLSFVFPIKASPPSPIHSRTTATITLCCMLWETSYWKSQRPGFLFCFFNVCRLRSIFHWLWPFKKSKREKSITVASFIRSSPFFLSFFLSNFYFHFYIFLNS